MGADEGNHAMEPFCSVIVPTRDRGEQVRACVANLRGLNYSRDAYEIIVVDDGSRVPLSLEGARVIRLDPGGPARARNVGARVARGQVLAFTDDDCFPEPDWLWAAVQAWREHPGDLLGGPVMNALADNPWSEASQMLVSYLYEYYNGTGGGPQFFTSNNMVVGRADFWEVGGFDEGLLRAGAEDREFCDRWRFMGRRLRFVPEMRVRHAHSLTARRFWLQHFRYGRGAHYYHWVRARRWNQPLRVEPVGFYLKLLRYPLRTRRSMQAWGTVFLFVVAQVANALGFFTEQGLYAIRRFR